MKRTIIEYPDGKNWMWAARRNDLASASFGRACAWALLLAAGLVVLFTVL